MERIRVNDGATLKKIIGKSPSKWKYYGFAMLPTRLLMDDKLTKSSLLVFWVLTVHVFKGKQYCFPSLKTISNEAHCSKPTAIRAIRELETLKYLDVERTRGRKSNRYYLKVKNL
ncbi:MAG: helix-turn-helix domain-containing protein [Candidatus Wildermuthbacteria bacterium]|nr:helix-turn-helix domain-containing protein [Candidatus Wildermuthbacteria bacterium]